MGGSHRQVHIIPRVVEEQKHVGRHREYTNVRLYNPYRREQPSPARGKEFNIQEDIEYLGCRLHRICGAVEELEAGMAGTMATIKRWGMVGHRRGAQPYANVKYAAFELEPEWHTDWTEPAWVRRATVELTLYAARNPGICKD